MAKNKKLKIGLAVTGLSLITSAAIAGAVLGFANKDSNYDKKDIRLTNNKITSLQNDLKNNGTFYQINKQNSKLKNSSSLSLSNLTPMLFSLNGDNKLLTNWIKKNILKPKCDKYHLNYNDFNILLKSYNEARGTINFAVQYQNKIINNCVLAGFLATNTNSTSFNQLIVALQELLQNTNSISLSATSGINQYYPSNYSLYQEKLLTFIQNYISNLIATKSSKNNDLTTTLAGYGFNKDNITISSAYSLNYLGESVINIYYNNIEIIPNLVISNFNSTTNNIDVVLQSLNINKIMKAPSSMSSISLSNFANSSDLATIQNEIWANLNTEIKSNTSLAKLNLTQSDFSINISNILYSYGEVLFNITYNGTIINQVLVTGFHKQIDLLPVLQSLPVFSVQAPNNIASLTPIEIQNSSNNSSYINDCSVQIINTLMNEIKENNTLSTQGLKSTDFSVQACQYLGQFGKITFNVLYNNQIILKNITVNGFKNTLSIIPLLQSLTLPSTIITPSSVASSSVSNVKNNASDLNSISSLIWNALSNSINQNETLKTLNLKQSDFQYVPVQYINQFGEIVFDILYNNQIIQNNIIVKGFKTSLSIIPLLQSLTLPSTITAPSNLASLTVSNIMTSNTAITSINSTIWTILNNAITTNPILKVLNLTQADFTFNVNDAKVIPSSGTIMFTVSYNNSVIQHITMTGFKPHYTNNYVIYTLKSILQNANFNVSGDASLASLTPSNVEFANSSSLIETWLISQIKTIVGSNNANTWLLNYLTNSITNEINNLGFKNIHYFNNDGTIYLDLTFDGIVVTNLLISGFHKTWNLTQIIDQLEVLFDNNQTLPIVSTTKTSNTMNNINLIAKNTIDNLITKNLTASIVNNVISNLVIKPLTNNANQTYAIVQLSYNYTNVGTIKLTGFVNTLSQATIQQTQQLKSLLSNLSVKLPPNSLYANEATNSNLMTYIWNEIKSLITNNKEFSSLQESDFSYSINASSVNTTTGILSINLNYLGQSFLSDVLVSGFLTSSLLITQLKKTFDATTTLNLPSQFSSIYADDVTVSQLTPFMNQFIVNTLKSNPYTKNTNPTLFSFKIVNSADWQKPAWIEVQIQYKQSSNSSINVSNNITLYGVESHF